MSNALNVLSKGSDANSSDINQLVGTLNGTVDPGALSLANPTSAPSSASTATLNGGGSLSGSYGYVVTYITGTQQSNGSVTVNGETTASAVSASVTASSQQISISAIPTGSAPVIGRRIYRNKSTGSATTGPFYLLTQIDDITTTTFPDNVPDSSLGAQAPSTNTTGTTITGSGVIPYAVDTSASANTITVSLSPVPSKYVDGQSVSVKVANTTTGATTLNINGLGAISVKNADGTAVGNGDLVAGVPRIFTYVAGSPAAFIAAGSGGLSASGTATPADVLTGYTFTSSGGRTQSGTMPNNGSPSVQPGINSQTLSAGYYSSITIQSTPYASGSVTSSTSVNATNFSFAGGGSSSFFYVSVSGLSFQPKVIRLSCNWANPNAKAAEDVTEYNAQGYPAGFTSGTVAMIWYYQSGVSYYYSYAIAAGGPLSVTNGAFTLPVNQSGTTYNWQAWG